MSAPVVWVLRARIQLRLVRQWTHVLRCLVWFCGPLYLAATCSVLVLPEDAAPRAPLREEARGSRDTTSRIRSRKKCKKKFYLGIHDRFIRDEKFRKNMFDIGRTEQICREMDKLADEDHTHNITPEEMRVCREQLVDSFEHSWFRYDASPAST